MKRRRKTIGKMTQTRAVWHINPVTRVVSKKRKQDNRRVAKQKLKKGEWE